MILKQKIGLIVTTQVYHLHQVRTLFVLVQEMCCYFCVCLTKKAESASNYQQIGYAILFRESQSFWFIRRKRVNPHSQLSAYNSRFRPS